MDGHPGCDVGDLRSARRPHPDDAVPDGGEQFAGRFCLPGHRSSGDGIRERRGRGHHRWTFRSVRRRRSSHHGAAGHRDGFGNADVPMAKRPCIGRALAGHCGRDGIELQPTGRHHRNHLLQARGDEHVEWGGVFRRQQPVGGHGDPGSRGDVGSGGGDLLVLGWILGGAVRSCGDGWIGRFDVPMVR